MTGNKTTQKSAWEQKLNRLEAELNLLNLTQAVKESIENNFKLLRAGIKHYDSIHKYTVITSQMASLEKKIIELKTKQKSSTPSHRGGLIITNVHSINRFSAPTPSTVPEHVRTDPPESFSCLSFVRSKLKTPSTSIPTTTLGLRT